MSSSSRSSSPDITQETQSQDQGLESMGFHKNETQDSQIITPGQRKRSDAPPPLPVLDKLSNVTNSFVREQVQVVEEKCVSLAILEEKHAKYDGYVTSQQVPVEYRVERKLPHLAPGCKFSVVARAEIETMFKVHDLVFMRRLRDDLQTKVIPDWKRELNETKDKARQKLKEECPENELDGAKRLFEAELGKKEGKRKELLELKRTEMKKRKEKSKQLQPPAKKQKPSFGQNAPFPPWGRGFHQQSQHNHWRHRQQDNYEQAGWRTPSARGRGRGRWH